MLCPECKIERLRKRYTSEELQAIAQKYAPNLIFTDKFKTKSGQVNYKCSICGTVGKTSVVVLERSREGSIYCVNCNNRRKKTKDEFTNQIKKYNENLCAVSEYMGANEKIKVKCTICGNIMIHKTPHDWFKNYKCYYCDKQPFNPNVENYSNYVIRNYGKDYSFLSNEWYGAKTNHLYYCNIHNEEFWQTPDNFIPERAQCPKCAEIRKVKWVKARTKEHNQYVAELGRVSPEIEVLGKYKSNTYPIAVRCRKCLHEWAPTAGPLLYQKTKCPKCVGALMTAKDFKKRVKANSPSLEIVGRFTRGDTLIRVRCKKCGFEWDGIKDVLIRGCGCKMCHYTGTSRQELMVYFAIKELFPKSEVLWRNHKLIHKELDIVIPSKGIAIEPGYFGWHKDKIDVDFNKEIECENIGIKLFTIYFSCQNAKISVPFKHLMCINKEASTKDEIIDLTMSIIEWIATEENWGNKYKHINYNEIWKKVNDLKLRKSSI